MRSHRPFARARARHAAGMLFGAAVAGACSVMRASEIEWRPPNSPARAAPSDSVLRIEMRNVDLRVFEDAVLHVEGLRGEVISTRANEPAVLDDPSSFAIRVTSARVALTGPDLSALLNRYVFAYPGAPLRRLRVRTSGSQLVQTGIMHKGVDLRFEITADVSLEPDGRVRLHPTRTRILGVNGAKLLHALGLRLDDVLDLSKARGATVKGDDFYLEPTKILPAPAITGRLAAIRVEGDRVVQDFVVLPDDSSFAASSRPAPAAANYVYFRGGRLRFGKLLMSDTDLQIVDADASDPFDLYLERYARQLVAGTSRTMPNEGLEVLMPDYHTVAEPAPVAARARLEAPHR